MSWKAFVNGETLDLGEVQDLMNQGVVPYASAAARNTAITQPVLGQCTFITGSKVMEYYDGSGWEPVPPAPGSGVTKVGRSSITANSSGVVALTFPTAFPTSLNGVALAVPVLVAVATTDGNFGETNISSLTVSRTGFSLTMRRSGDNGNAGALPYLVNWQAISLPS